MTNLHEPVSIRFRGHERTLPLAALAISFRRGPERTASTLELLILGPPEHRTPTTEERVPPLHDRGEGVGGGVCADRSERSDTMGSETIGSETLGPGTSEENILGERSDPNRSERERSEGERSDARAREDGVDDGTLARMIAADLADEENVGAIRRLVATYPRPLLDRALRRTLAVPADRIRSSRGAIFTGIVRKLALEHGPLTPSPTDV